MPSLRDSLDFPRFTQDFRPGLTYVAAPRLGIGAFCSTPLVRIVLLHSAPLLRVILLDHSRQNIVRTISISHARLNACSLKRRPPPRGFFFGLLRFFFQINLEDVNLVELGIEDTRHNHAAALESVHEVRAIQPIDIFSGRQH